MVSRPAVGLSHALRQFGRGQRGATTIGTLFGVFILVLVLAVLVEHVNEVYRSDEYARAARAAARALALDPNADECAAIRRELGEDEQFDCTATLVLKTDHDVDPEKLPATLDIDPPTGTGELVLVRIGWTEQFVSFGDLLSGSTEGSPFNHMVMGVFRAE